MRSLIPYLLLVFVLAACSNDENQSYIVLDDITLGQAEQLAVTTRAVDPALCIEIRDAAGALTHSFMPGQTQAGQKIEMSPGNYTITAFTANLNTVYTGSEAGEAKYCGATTFSVQQDRTTHVKLAAPMVNIGVALALPEGFHDLFANYTFTVSYNGRTVTLADGQTAYFDVPSTQDVHEIAYTLIAVNADGEIMSSSATCTVQPGKLYTVTYQFAK